MLPAIMAGMAIAGAVTSTVASLKANQADKKSLKDKEAAKYLEIAELKRRSALNQELLARKLNTTSQAALSTFAVSSSGGAGTATDEQFADALSANISSELERAKAEADYDIMMSSVEAQSIGTSISEKNRLTPYLVAGGLLGGAKDMYSIYKNTP